MLFPQGKKRDFIRYLHNCLRDRLQYYAIGIVTWKNSCLQVKQFSCCKRIRCSCTFGMKRFSKNYPSLEVIFSNPFSLMINIVGDIKHQEFINSKTVGNEMLDKAFGYQILIGLIIKKIWIRKNLMRNVIK